MSIEPKELRPEQKREITVRSGWPMRSYGIEYQKQAEEDVRALLGHIAALEKINARANDRIGKGNCNAERYEWLRSNNDPGPDVVRCVTLDQTTEPVETRLCFGDDLDAKIDAEMAAAGAK